MQFVIIVLGDSVTIKPLSVLLSVLQSFQCKVEIYALMHVLTIALLALFSVTLYAVC